MEPSLENNHRLAVSLLDRLGLTHLYLTRRQDGTYRGVAWRVPLVDGSGSPRVIRRRHKVKAD